jgi:hypothetical protein
MFDRSFPLSGLKLESLERRQITFGFDDLRDEGSAQCPDQLVL